MERITYCDNCCDDTEYEIRDEIINVNLKGQKFSYGALIPYCKICGKEVSVPEINDLNILRAYGAQKKSLENDAR